MSDRWLVSFLLAIFLELSHWVPLRWDFQPAALVRAWRLTCLVILMAAAFIWFEGNRYYALPRLLGWLPAVLVPMQFVQSYGLADKIPAFAFSFFAESRRKRAERLGLPLGETFHFHFGHIYFGACLLAASQGTRADSPFFLPGLMLLLAMLFLRTSRRNIATILILLMAAGAGAKIGAAGLDRLAELVSGRGRPSGVQRFNPRTAHTNIGERGRVILPRDIVWRLHLGQTQRAPRLLRTATFSRFDGKNWNSPHSERHDFTDLDAATITGEDSYYLLQPAAMLPQVPALPHFSLRGEASEETPLPLPGNTAALRDFDLDGIERNPLGLVRVYPKEAIINGEVFWNSTTNPELPPTPAANRRKPEDLQIPPAEIPALQPILANIGISTTGTPPPLKPTLDKLLQLFLHEFQYSRNLEITRSPRETTAGPATPIGKFLTTSRRGHCEYFATAAVLLLRQAGIPARYATGYATAEFDGKRREFTIRKNHGHAWCRVWNASANQWIDFDPTPPSWLETLDNRASRLERFSDSIKRIREDFFVWRNNPAHRFGVTLSMAAIGLSLAGFIFIRLWHSRRKITKTSASYPSATPITTALHRLEKRARRVLGERPPGMSFPDWLRKLRDRLQHPHHLDEAIQIHQRVRFDPQPANTNLPGHLTLLVNELEKEIRNLPRGSPR